MRQLSLVAAIIGCAAFANAAALTTASAEVVSKTVTMHHGAYGHGCRTVRTVKHGMMGKRVVVRKICR